VIHRVVSTFLTSLTPFLFSLAKINERIEYKLLSLTHKVLTTARRAYLYKLISLIQIGRLSSSKNSLFISCNHLSASLIFRFKNHESLILICITLSLESTPASFRLHHPNHSHAHSSHLIHVSYSLPSSPLSPSITPNIFHSRLKTHLFPQILPTID